MMDRRAAVCALVLAFFQLTSYAPSATAAEGVVAPQGVVRKAILDALRAPVAKELGPPIEFVVKQIGVLQEWSFVMADLQRPGGVEIDWANTVCSGDVSHLVGGLLRQEGEGWTVVDYVLCPTDVTWATWPEEHGAPAALFEPD